MSAYLDKLRESSLSLMIYRGGEIVFSSSGHGIMPFLEAIDRIGESDLKGAVVVDKIMGRAAAFLALYIAASEAHAALISTGARELFKLHGLRFIFESEAPMISGWGGAGMCPFERSVEGITDPSEAFERLRAKAAELRRGAR